MTLFLCGDVMLGRGVDQILAHPGDPRLQEPLVKDARDYVALAERVNGPIARPVDDSWPWGDSLPELDAAAPDVRVINLETAVTGSDDLAAGKAVHYRMSPGNLACLLAGDPDACVLANNHELDFGAQGWRKPSTCCPLPVYTPRERDATSKRLGDRSRSPSRTGDGCWCSRREWPPAASRTRGSPGVAFLAEPSLGAVREVIGHISDYRRSGDVVVSIHWGSNWGYEISRRQVRLAHALIDGGVDVVHGHSSHHPRPLEVYRDRLILYGCGDFINDYEGITGHERYRADLRLLYLVSLARSTGELVGLQMIPMRTRQMQPRHASRADLAWLRASLDRVSRPFDMRVGQERGGALTIQRLVGALPG